MSIIGIVTCPEGIVVAADSRSTMYVGTLRISNDYYVKMRLLKKRRIGITWCGSNLINGCFMQELLEQFEEKCLYENETIQGIAEILNRQYIHSSEVTLLLCGYQNDRQEVISIQNEKIAVLSESVMPFAKYDIYLRGKSEAVDKLLNLEPPLFIPYSLMPLSEAVAFLDFLLNTVIQIEKFQFQPQTCGGPIDILAIKRDEAFWIRNKMMSPPS